jgi:carbon-monoxide dehydrogenase medium subunit
VISASFEYHRPGSIEEAVKVLARLGAEGKVLAGGHSLIPMMKLRLARPGHLVDLQGIGALRGIKDGTSDIRIGAMTTQAEVVGSSVLAAKLPLLVEAAQQIADPQVRNLGTVGGNIANGDPGNDMPAVMMALDASYVLRGPKGERSVPARAFYKGLFETAMQPDELLTEVRIPAPQAGSGQSYQKMKRKVGDYAIAAAAVVLGMAKGKCTHAAIALTNVAATPIFADAAGKALIGTPVDAAAAAKAADLAAARTDPASDMRGPPEFRKHVAAVMVKRAIDAARARAKGA